MRRSLERDQVGSRLNLLLATDSRLEIQRGIASAEGLASGAARDLASIQAEQNAYQGQWRSQVAQDVADRRRQLEETRENLNKARLRRSLIEMRAPADSVVLEIGKTSVGAVLAPGELLVSLVPLATQLEVDAEVQPRDVGFVAVGDQVRIKFETYPYIRHGTASGTVRTLSEDTTRDRDAVTAQQQQQRYYRARVTMDQMNLRNLPVDFRLMPGMPVQADIVVGERTILSYLFDRVVPTLREGMREP
jgi:HlyD family type I secretion membrane fusion protein